MHTRRTYNEKGCIYMKFSELVKKCESAKIDCDKCEAQKECAKFADYLDGMSPIGIKELVESDKEVD